MEKFSFTKQERRGILYIVLLIILFFTFIYYIEASISEEKPNFTKFEKELNIFEKQQTNQKLIDDTKYLEEQKLRDSIYKQKYYNKYNNYDKNYTSTYNKKKKNNYHNFNPNTATEAEWQSFGFSEKQTKIIVNFIKKSGGIKTKNDLKKIFVIDDKKYQELSSFIQIEPIIGEKLNESNLQQNKLDLNSATLEQLDQVKGIGTKTAERILKYRQILGGYVSLTQLNEVYGISEENYLTMKLGLLVNRLNILKINVNFADKQELSNHPYITYEEAKKIIDYRSKNGAFTSVNELFTNKLITNENLRYYLTNE
jgi:competence ComEA-like helix-hairpin-helix protein